LWVLGMVVGLLVAACSGGSGRSTATTAGEALPPPHFPELAAIFDPVVAPLGVRVTRAALVSTSTRRPSPTGRHLAIYVEPVEPGWSYARYADTIVPLTDVLGTSLFDRYSEVESFDVCQEPPPGVDDRREPDTVATVDLTRETWEAIDWDTADLETLLAASLGGQGGLRMVASEALQAEPAYQNARAAAEARD
jgi:hypothetical protein